MGQSIFPVSDFGSRVRDAFRSVRVGVWALTYLPDFWAAFAIMEIYYTYGEVVDIKPKGLHKFGENLLVGTDEAVLMPLPSGVTFPPRLTDNLVTHISSSDAGDTGDAFLEGGTIDGNGDISFVRQPVTLNGQTKVALDTPLMEPTRLENDGDSDFAGSIYVYEDDTVTAGVPQTASKIHLIVPSISNSDITSENQSMKARTIIAADNYELVTQVKASINDKVAAAAVVRMRVANGTKAWRTLFKRGLNSTGPDINMQFRPYLIIKRNSRVMLTAEADGANTPISGGWNSLLASVREYAE